LIDTEQNSVWWRWTASTTGVVTLDVPDGGGTMNVTIYRSAGRLVSNLVEVATNPVNPAAPNLRLNHVQFAVGQGEIYAIAVRSVRSDTGSWLPPLPWDLPVIPGREFTLRMDFVPQAVGPLLVKQVGPMMMASFAAVPGRSFSLDRSLDLQSWVAVNEGVTTGVTQLMAIPIEPSVGSQFFRIHLAP
jgi:hypothetical protein